MQYVLVPTNSRINHIGGIFGPFDSIDEAQTALDNMNFPTPEEVLIRPLNVPVTEEVNWKAVKEFFEGTIDGKEDITFIVWNKEINKELTVTVPRKNVYNLMIHLPTTDAIVQSI